MMKIRQTDVIERVRSIWRDTPLQASCLEVIVQSICAIEDRLERLEKRISQQSRVPDVEPYD